MTKKLDKVDLETIQSLSHKFNEITTKLTDIIIQEHIIANDLDALKATKTDILLEFDSARQQEQTVLSALETKYGRGEINIKDGTFTPADTEYVHQATTDNI